MNPFETALELFGDNGEHWTQHADVGEDDNGEAWFCARGALRQACRRTTDTVFRTETAVDYPTYFHAMHVLAAQIRGYPVDEEDLVVIPVWNDADERTYEDIQLAFKHCAHNWNG